MSRLYFALRLLFILYCFFVLQTDTSGNNCSTGFACGALCIPIVWTCDGDADCADGSDEQNCATNCNPKTEFKCDNKCIPTEWQCDTEYDCADRSDEEDCGCPDGTFGNNCSSTCGKCREGTACRNDNGVCPNGCQDGYQGIYCINECDDGKYGTNCSGDCGECRNNQTCDKVDGHCPEGCEDGYMYEPLTCNNGCPDGTFGNNCSSTCGKCREGTACRNDNGVCPNGCQDGYQGIYCINECDDGKYGTNCSGDCGECRNNQTCDKVDGHCPEGCEDGYMYEPLTCNMGIHAILFECINGTYGTNCSMNCGNCGNNETCNKSNGFCPNGCEERYTPPTCSEELIKEENGSKCDSPTLYVIVITVAVFGLTVAITLIFIIAKRWNRPNAVLKSSEIEMLQP